MIPVPSIFRRLRAATVISTLALLGLPLAAQQSPAPAGIARPSPSTAATKGAVPAPPVSPRRAFFYSLMVPGAGQAALGRYKSGGLYFLTEGLALAMVHRSAEELRLARQFRGDSTPATYQLDQFGQPVLGSDGRPVAATWNVARFDAARVRARRTHYEDWIALVVFAHLFSGADAYVAAQLWDLPARVGVQSAPNGQPAVAARIDFR